MTIPESTPARLYLDIDGVLLAESSEFFDTVERSQGVYSKVVAERLGRLSVEGVWLTTSDYQTPRLTKELGLNNIVRSLPRGEDFDFEDQILNHFNRFVAWKYQALIEDQKRSPSPFVWVDDRLTRSLIDDAHERFADRPHLLVVTKNSVGLRERDLRAIENFCQQQQ